MWKVALFAVFCFSFTFSHANEYRWQWVKGWENQGLRWDSNSLRIVGNKKVRVWYQIEVIESQRLKLISEGILATDAAMSVHLAKNSLIIDCMNKTYAFLAVSWMSKDGIRLEGADMNSADVKHNYIPPDSPFEAIELSVCKPEWRK